MNEKSQTSTSALVIIAMIIFGFLVYSTGPNHDSASAGRSLDDLEYDISELRSEVEDLSGSNNNLSSEVGSLRDEIDNLQSQIDDLYY